MIWWKLEMVRGKRTVFIGLFPSLYRAEIAAGDLDWNPGWKWKIERGTYEEVVDGIH